MKGTKQMKNSNILSLFLLIILSVAVFSACQQRNSVQLDSDPNSPANSDTSQAEPDAVLLEQEVTSDSDDTETIQSELDNTVILEEDFSDL